MAKKFEVLALPNEAIEPLVKAWDPDVVIDATMRSPSFKEQIEIFKLDCDSMDFIAKPDKVELTARFKMTEVKMSCVQMSDEYFAKSKVRKVNGTYVKSSISERHVNGIGQATVYMEFNCDDQSMKCQQAALEQVLKHLLSIVKVKTFNFTCKQLSPMFVDLFFWKYSKIFGTIKVERADLRPTIVSPESLVFLLEELRAEKRDLRIKVDGFKYEKPIQGKHLYINSLNWITSVCFMSPEAVKIKTHSHPCSELDINELLKNWVNGGCPNLETLSLDISRTNATEEGLYRGLPLKPTIFTAAELNRRLSDIPMKPVDIKRDTDGRLATLTFMEGMRVEMSVWHRKHLLFLDPAIYGKLKQHHYGPYFS